MTIIRHPLKSLAELSDSRQRTSGFTSTDRMLVQDETVTESKWFRPSLLAQNTINLLGTQYSSILVTGDDIAVQANGQTETKYASPSLLARGLISMLTTQRTSPALDSSDYFAVRRSGESETKYCSGSMLSALASIADGSVTTVKLASAAAVSVTADNTAGGGSLPGYSSWTTCETSSVYLASADLPAVIVSFGLIDQVTGTGVTAYHDQQIYSRLLMNGSQYGSITKSGGIKLSSNDSYITLGCSPFLVGTYYTTSSSGYKSISLQTSRYGYTTAYWQGAKIVNLVFKNTSLT